jgi:hypothetical protein
MYVGNSPLAVSPPAGITNPVLTSDDVTDASASFVADPFMLFKDAGWHMFFEVLVDNGDIGYASSLDGLNWTYQQIVINETFHMMADNGTGSGRPGTSAQRRRSRSAPWGTAPPVPMPSCWCLSAIRV